MNRVRDTIVSTFILNERAVPQKAPTPPQTPPQSHSTRPNIDIKLFLGRDVKLRKHSKNYKNSEWSKDLVSVCSRWKRLTMVTPCKRMKPAGANGRSLEIARKRWYEPRRGSVMVKTSWCYHDRPPPTLTTILGTVFKLRSQASLHGVNHNMPFPTALKLSFRLFQCSRNFTSTYNW